MLSIHLVRRRSRVKDIHRICSGKDLADASLFISVAMIIAVLDIGKCTENGVIIEPEATYSNGLTRCDPSSYS